MNRILDDTEPVFFHPRSKFVFRAWYKRFHATHVVDYTLGTGDAAAEAAAAQISYSGLAFTDKHKNEVWEKLHRDTLRNFCTEGLECHRAPGIG